MVPKQPSIEILGIRFDEPVTTLTDLLVTAVCWYAYYHMHHSEVKNKSALLMKYYFLITGMATLLGGLIGHGFNYALSLEWKIPGWVTSMVAIMLIERASIEYTRPLIMKSVGDFFLWLNIVELLVLMSLACYLLDFNWVLVHLAYGLGVMVGGFHLFTYLKTGSFASKRIMQAVLVASVGALFFINEWYINEWFNHVDIGHVGMAGGVWFFYLGARQMVIDESFSKVCLEQDVENPV